MEKVAAGRGILSPALPRVKSSEMVLIRNESLSNKNDSESDGFYKSVVKDDVAHIRSREATPERYFQLQEPVEGKEINKRVR